MTENEQVSQPEVLASSGINFPFFLHKIKASHWNYSNDLDNDLDAKVQGAVELIFNDIDNIYSLWLAVNNEDLCAILTQLNSGRDSFNEAIDFIWLTAEELKKLGINPIQKDENPVCLRVKSLHHNAAIDSSQSVALCNLLMRPPERKPFRCVKGKMKQISAYMQSINCLAHKKGADNAQCECELSAY